MPEDTKTGGPPADPAAAYESGKDRRYKLLFAVNGGAFAVAQLLVGSADKQGVVVGGLRLWQLAIGMGVFTTAMVIDVDAFGLKMRRKDDDLFRRVGPVVLWLLGALIVAGWTLVGVPRCWTDREIGETVGGAIVVYTVVFLGHHWHRFLIGLLIGAKKDGA
jgi:hypothetical protein